MVGDYPSSGRARILAIGCFPICFFKIQWMCMNLEFFFFDDSNNMCGLLLSKVLFTECVWWCMKFWHCSFPALELQLFFSWTACCLSDSMLQLLTKACTSHLSHHAEILSPQWCPEGDPAGRQARLMQLHFLWKSGVILPSLKHMYLGLKKFHKPTSLRICATVSTPRGMISFHPVEWYHSFYFSWEQQSTTPTSLNLGALCTSSTPGSKSVSLLSGRVQY